MYDKKKALSHSKKIRDNLKKKKTGKNKPSKEIDYELFQGKVGNISKLDNREVFRVRSPAHVAGQRG